MGNTYTVEAWGMHDEQEYSYMTTWQGESMIRAMIEMWKAKRKGYGCVTLSWR